MTNSPLGGPGSNKPPGLGLSPSVLPGGETKEVTRSPWSADGAGAGGSAAAYAPAAGGCGDSLLFLRFLRARPEASVNPLRPSANVPSSPRPPEPYLAGGSPSN